MIFLADTIRQKAIVQFVTEKDFINQIFIVISAGKNLIGVKKMTDKTCKTCIENDNGLCDRKGILIEDDDTCEKHTVSWEETMKSMW